MRDRTDVAVLGAGLTGLSTALFVDRAGGRRRVFEREARPGGHAVTVEENGYRFDRTGHLLHLRDPEMRALCERWLGGDFTEIRRESRVWSHGTYTPYPFQANTFGLPPAVAYECLMGFLEAHFAPEKKPAANFEEFCLAHFGAGISRHFMIPYNTRLWGVSPREITAEWCARFVPLPKLEDVVAGAVGARPAELGYNARFLYPRLGIGELTAGIAREVEAKGAVEISRAPVAVDENARELVFEDGARVGYESLVSTAPLPALVKLLVHAPAHVRDAAAKLRCTHLYYLDVALRTPVAQPLHWVYVPEAKYPFYRVGSYSNFSSALAPPGCGSLYVELADRAPPDLERVLPAVAEALVEMKLVHHAHAIKFARVRRIDHAYVIFDHAYFDALEAVRPYLESRRIVTAGRYGGWNYSSMEDALLFGRDAAWRALGGAGAASEPRVGVGVSR